MNYLKRQREKEREKVCVCMCACVVYFHKLLIIIMIYIIVRFLFSRYRRCQEIHIESRIAGIGIGRKDDKVRETLWSGGCYWVAAT